MAEVNTDSKDVRAGGVDSEVGSKSQFIFGQNMEARAVRVSPPPESGGAKGTGEENGHPPAVAYMSRTHTSPARGSAPPAQQKPLYPATNTLSSNPFAVRPASGASSPYTSDDDEKKESRPIIAPASLRVSAKSGSKPDTGGPFILKPSAFGVKSSPETKPLLKPATLKSPNSKSESEEKEDKPNNREEKENTEKEDNSKTVLDNNSDLSSSGNYFTQFLKKDSSLGDSLNDSSAGFIFGQNLADRVTNNVSPGSSLSSSADFLFGQNLADRVTNNIDKNEADEKAEFTFGEKIGDRVSSKEEETKKVDENDKEKSENKALASPTGKTLAESASEYLAKHSQKQEYEAVKVVTGEENEKNVLQMNCKLFVFDKNTVTWNERGRGSLRVNDMTSAEQHFQSRIVMRTAGSLRVILNSKIWNGMTVEKANERSVRISAMDENTIRVFLAMGSAKDADQLYGAIDWRIQQLKMSDEDSAGESSTEGQLAEKRRHEDSPEESPPRKSRRGSHDSRDPHLRRDMKEESNDSSTVDPETEASNESFGSSPAVRSSSSEY